MAGRDGSPPGKKEKRPSKSNNFEESEEKTQAIKLDLGDDNSRKHANCRLGNQNSGAGTSSGDIFRREENPFSLKHYLRSTSGYQNKGARPKVYCDGRPVTSLLDPQINIATDNPSVLPDFVQDHLVIEQSYSSNGPNQNYSSGVQLPDFAQNSPGSRQNAEVAVSKSLPDFLNDGAVRNQNGEHLPDSQSPDTPERLQREVDHLRQQLTEQTNRSDLLQSELEEVRNQEIRHKKHLIQALHELEENLKKSNKRASSAEATVLMLRQEITSLKKEIKVLKTENSAWGSMDGAIGGPPTHNLPNHSQRLAQELRNAASTAESSLRQLLSGVDNLRLMASTLENMHRIEESNENFLNSDENSGPAL